MIGGSDTVEFVTCLNVGAVDFILEVPRFSFGMTRVINVILLEKKKILRSNLNIAENRRFLPKNKKIF